MDVATATRSRRNRRARTQATRRKRGIDPSAPEVKRKHTAAKKANREKKGQRNKKPARKPKADRANRKAEIGATVSSALS